MSPKRPLPAAGAVLAGLLLLMLAQLLAFTGYTLRCARRPHRPGAEVIVVLGCRLREGGPGRLLTTRLDRAVEVYRVERERGNAPVVVVSGGLHADDEVTEAEAMARYLEGAGIPREGVVVEDRARNTEENLRFAVREMRIRGIDPDAARITVVTSDFHVLRTAGLVRVLGLRAEVVGARTSRCLTRFAYLREFVAVLVMAGRVPRVSREAAA
ncbi:YdcF family protein [Nocardia sp. 2]|uniref:YdcF family protein n=1 Tax=Nocardia acididurans TaxID=2802282 RepID=A0ABS1MJ06_9NOCA|nr:YdcF family protein [Nocardia acididurans]MBL1079659.1 YdcF family protein [Nocardia acididurans]